MNRAQSENTVFSIARTRRAWTLGAGWRTRDGALRGRAITQRLKRNAYWWLISPAGNPVFYTGLCGPPSLNWDVTPITGRAWEFAPLPAISAPGWMNNPWVTVDNTRYYSFVTGNLIRKSGAANWQVLSTARTAQPRPRYSD